MRFFGPLVEQRIREAQEEGKFKNLSGEGAPLDVEENPFEDPERRLGYKILRNAGYCPPWMDLLKEIDADIAAAQRMWEDYRAKRRSQMDAVHRGTVMHFAEMVEELDSTRDRALRRLETRWSEINKKINHFNAIVPVESLRRLPLRVDRQREQFEREFPLLGGIVRR